MSKKYSKAIEESRLTLQKECDDKKSQAERNKLGQFATPTDLATDVLSYAKTLVPESEPIRFLDPAIGTGSFYAALLRTFGDRRIAMAQGYEIDLHYAEPAMQLWGGHDLQLTVGDFTKEVPPQRKFNLIICNPPYVRHHHIDIAEKAQLHIKAAKIAGVQLSGLAGLYCYFMAIAHDWLADDGIAGWLIPSEFMDVNYGGPIKEYLLNRVELLRIHRFDPTELQFGDALVSSAVVWLRKRSAPENHSVEFTFGGTLAEPRLSRRISRTELQKEVKWSRFPAADVRTAEVGPTLGDFFQIKRGLVTGDNSFFIMTKEQIEQRKLPYQFFRPILPGPRYLMSDEIDGDENGLPMVERKLFLLDCRLSEDEVQEKYPNLWAYFESGKETVAERYLSKHRSPWYLQESRLPAPIVCTYMGRGFEEGKRPFRFLFNKSQAIAANVYLMLYPRAELSDQLADTPALIREIWQYLNKIDPASLLGEGRVYGGGLYKMEPKELANVPVKTITALTSVHKRRQPEQTTLFEAVART